MKETRNSKNNGLASKLGKAVKNLPKAAVVASALLMPYAMNNETKAETIRITNYAPDSSTIGDSQASLQYTPGFSSGYDAGTPENPDGGDKELSTYLANPTNKNFVIYFPLDNSGTDFNAETNFINHMQVGDTYTAHLAFCLAPVGIGIFGAVG